ncbi:unnamed protein product [Urochloa humidicola]
MMCPQFLRLHLQFARACNQRGKIHSKAKEIKKVPSDLQNIHRCSCDGFCTHWCSAPPVCGVIVHVELQPDVSVIME